jgi:pyruvate/2-oxoglutarate dehydrogenase complex dihydrolipoamide dehydrogenase (E3) component
MARRYDLVIVGMGSAGLVAAEFAARLDLRVAAVEADRLGGDCLWTGCVPSKTLLAAAKAAQTMRTADRHGLTPVEPQIEPSRVWRRIREVQERIASTDDSPEWFEAMGVELVSGRARLAGPNAVAVDGRTLETRFILLCTGSHPATPSIPGLEGAAFVTSESVFELESPPRSWIVIGGGPIGTELAQGLRRLGMDVTLLQRGPRLLPRDEPELTERLAELLRAEGVTVRLGTRIERVEVEDGRKAVYADGSRFEAEELLVAAGRTPAVEGLGLEEVGIRVGSRGVEVDSHLRTSVPSIYAVGDVAGRHLFTHSAAAEAGLALRNMFFPGKDKPGELVPWCTFTDPELAHAGLTVAEARERFGGDAGAASIDLARSDRARAEAEDEGRIVLALRKGRIVGAHVLAPSAGELIHELVLAIRKKMQLRKLFELVHVYPTISTSIATLAGETAVTHALRYRWLVRKEKA